MGTAAVKLILSLASGIVCHFQYQAEKSIAATFCFIISAILFVGFAFDMVRIWRHKKIEGAISAKKASAHIAAPSAKDYPDAPDPADLKTGKIYRAVNVNQFVDNIQSLARENPDYMLSESEMIDNYLTDKKIWKYSFRLKNITLNTLPEKQNYQIGVFCGDKQLGCIDCADNSPLLNAINRSGVEVLYCTIGGGPYKIVHDDVRTGQYSTQSGEKPYSMTLSIIEK